MCRKELRFNASATVEAAYIVPFMFFVILSVIVLILMFYDRLKLKGDIGETLEYARLQREQTGSFDTGALKRYLEKEARTGYLFCDVEEITVDVKGNEIKVSASIAMRTPAGAAGFRMPAVSKVSGSTSVGDREQIMRLIAEGRDIVGKVVE